MLRILFLACLVLLAAGPGCDGDPQSPPAVPASPLVIDQENLTDGRLLGQGFGRFSDRDGHGDPDGSTWDLQSAQVVTAARGGLLARIALPIRNTLAATRPVVLHLRPVWDDGAPVGGDDAGYGVVSLPAAAFVGVDVRKAATWPAFDVSGLGLVVEPGRKYAFSLSSTDTCGYLYGPEETWTYDGGAAWRRNFAVTVGWVELPGRDFCFRTWVDTTGVTVACRPAP